MTKEKLFMTKEMWERFMMIWNLLVVSQTRILPSALGIVGETIYHIFGCTPLHEYLV